jgi:hypothetical protein
MTSVFNHLFIDRKLKCGSRVYVEKGIIQFYFPIFIFFTRLYPFCTFGSKTHYVGTNSSLYVWSRVKRKMLSCTGWERKVEKESKINTKDKLLSTITLQLHL